MSSSSPPTLVLERGPLRVEVDPSHGAELRSVRHSRVGELLWRAPAAAPARHGDLDEATWTAQYGGGWQVLFPNAGDASPTHGFHGAASTAPWSVVAHDTDSAVLAWTGHGLAIERHLALGDSGRLELRDAVHNLGGTPLPYLLGHHPTFGGALLDEPCAIELPGGALTDLDSGARGRWPALGDNDWRSVDPTRQLYRFGAVTSMPEGRAVLRRAGTGIGIELTWPVEDFPAMWLWVDVCAMDAPPWRGQARLVALEPVTAPHHGGLTAVIADGQAPVAQPGQPRTHTLAFRVLEDSAR